jgi:DNA-binding beta-propeller fold protein YncE
MTRLGKASALLAVFACDYAILMLINGQPTDFDISAGVCVVALLGAALFEYVVRLSRKTLADGRAAVWERRDRETSTIPVGGRVQDITVSTDGEHIYVARSDSVMVELATGSPT